VAGKAAKCCQNSAVAEDFIERFYTAGCDIGFGLCDKATLFTGFGLVRTTSTNES
jgi:hypothetical protein